MGRPISADGLVDAGGATRRGSVLARARDRHKSNCRGARPDRDRFDAQRRIADHRGAPRWSYERYPCAVRLKPRLHHGHRAHRSACGQAVHGAFACVAAYAASALASAGMITIQLTPKRSTSMPNRFEKNVSQSGIVTWPRSDSAANLRSASASFATVSDSEKPWKFLSPLAAQPSEAISTVSPILRLQCMTLSPQLSGTMPGCGGQGLSLKRISISTSAPSTPR